MDINSIWQWKSRSRFGVASGPWVGLALMLACVSLYDENSQDADDKIIKSQQALIESQRILGFEDPTADWSIVEGGQGVVTSGTERTQGAFALAVNARGFVPIRSTTMSSIGPDIGETVSYDLRLPSQQPNPYWFGATQFYVNAPSVGLWNRYIGQVELTGLPTGTWTKIEMSLPTSVSEALRGSYTDLQVTVVINVPHNAIGLYLLDNISFGTDTAPDAGTSEDTAVDLCQGVVCTAIDQCHNIGTCDPSTGICTNPEKIDGIACNDGNLCTQMDACQAGICLGVPIICIASSQCHVAGTCDPTMGTCTNLTKADGSTCDDGNPCTQSDQCEGGQCTGTQVVCPLLSGCMTPGICDPGSGVCSESTDCGSCGNGILDPDEECDDGNDDDLDFCTNNCTVNHCFFENNCIGLSPSGICLEFVCEPQVGCVERVANDGTSCNDDDVCTENSQCTAGFCLGGAPITCAETACQESGICLPQIGCVGEPKPNGISCNDGDACTSDDQCLFGKCAGALMEACFDEKVTPVDPTVPTSVGSSTAFLYSGSDPIQVGLVSTAIRWTRAAVVRGKAIARGGLPIGLVRVSIIDHPEFGFTHTRENGFFDLAVNGGGQFHLRYEHPEFLTIERSIFVPVDQFVIAPDVVMTALDNNVTTIDFPSSTVQIARSSVVSDEDGTRQATLIFQPGTTATIAGVPATQLNIRATEYTIGDMGPSAMPGSLPVNSAYTYAVELTADEAQKQTVRFSRPVAFYLENFVGFRTGVPLAVGSYRKAINLKPASQLSAWCADENGRTVEILNILDGFAILDVDGTGMPASPAALHDLGITDEERMELAEIYAVGQKLWRAPLSHFSAIDINGPIGLPHGFRFAHLETLDKERPKPQPCEEDGSIVECENQVLGQSVSIAGTSLTLNYRSSRTPGDLRDRKVRVAIKPLDAAADLPDRAFVEVNVAGRVIQTPVSPAALRTNPFVDFEWDGTDVYGRYVQGAQKSAVRIGFTYPIIYQEPEDIDFVFGNWSRVMPDTTLNRDAAAITFFSDASYTVGTSPQPQLTLGSMKSDYVGLGGWTLKGHHTYDARTHTAILGDGDFLLGDDVKRVITRFAGNRAGTPSSSPLQNGPALTVPVTRVRSIAVAPDGTVAFLSDNHINEISPDGIVTQFPASGFGLNLATGLTFGPDGALYFAERLGNFIPFSTAIRRVPSAPFTAGRSLDYESVFSFPGLTNDLAITSDGTFYISVGSTILKRDPCGRLTTVIGTPEISGSTPDGTPAADILLPSFSHIAIGPDDTLFIGYAGRIIQVGADGIQRTVAGTGVTGFSGDGGPATSAQISSGRDLAIGPDGSLYFTDNGSRIRRIDARGIITTIAGTGANNTGNLRENDTALQAIGPMSDTSGALAFYVDGSLLFSRGPSSRDIVRIDSILPGVSDDQTAIVKGDGSEIYVFNPEGRHLSTQDTLTGIETHRFDYDEAGQLVTITDRNGLTTIVERDAAGQPLSFIAPGGQRTTLTSGPDGYLSSIADPAGNTVHFTYRNDLMETMIDPDGNTSHYEFDEYGALLRTENAVGGFNDFARSGSGDAYVVTKTSAEGRTTSYSVEYDEQGSFREEVTGPSGLTTLATRAVDGRREIRVNGVTQTSTLAPHPRFGFQAPFERLLTRRLPNGLQMTVERTRNVTVDPSTGVLLTDQINSLVNSRLYRRTYDAASRTVTFTTPLQLQSTNTLDENGRLLRSQVGTLAEINYSYDERGRLLSVTRGTGAAARVTSFGYDAKDRINLITDPLGRTYQMTHDDADRTTQSLSPMGSAIDYTYDASGNVLSIKPPDRDPHVMGYSSIHLQNSYVPPSVGPENWGTSWSYNLDKQLSSTLQPDGTAIHRNYDSGGRLVGIIHPGGSRSYEYQGATLQINRSLSEDGIETEHIYNGPLQTSTVWRAQVDSVITRQFNNDFRLTQETVNGSFPTIFSYDADGRLQSIGTLIITRDANGRINTKALGSIRESRSYNEFGERISDISISLQNGTVYLENAYTQDKLGRITRKIETFPGGATTHDYDYDLEGRLIEVRRNGVVTAVYTYDANGNRLSVARPSGMLMGSYDAQDRLLAYGDYRYEYTQNGEVKTRTNLANNTTTQYAYDVYGALKRVDLPDGRVIEYLTDAQSRRVIKKINGDIVQRWVYSGALSIVAELDANGNVVSRIVGGQYMQRGGTIYHLVRDHLGSVRFVIDTTTSQVIQQLDYDEFGRVLLDTNPGFQPLGYAGGHYDPDTGLVRFGARDYDPEIGRWTAKDPILFKGGDTLLYSYAAQDPLNHIDPSGLLIASTSGEVWEALTYLATIPELSWPIWRMMTDPRLITIKGLETARERRTAIQQGGAYVSTPDRADSYFVKYDIMLADELLQACGYPTLSLAALLAHELGHVLYAMSPRSDPYSQEDSDSMALGFENLVHTDWWRWQHHCAGGPQCRK